MFLDNSLAGHLLSTISWMVSIIKSMISLVNPGYTPIQNVDSVAMSTFVKYPTLTWAFPNRQVGVEGFNQTTGVCQCGGFQCAAPPLTSTLPLMFESCDVD